MVQLCFTMFGVEKYGGLFLKYKKSPINTVCYPIDKKTLKTYNMFGKWEQLFLVLNKKADDWKGWL